MYMAPQADVICFTPAAAIAVGFNPSWGFEEDVFGDGDGVSTGETTGASEDDSQN